MKRYLIPIFLLVLAGCSANEAVPIVLPTTDTPQAPYLFYYSSMLDTFVVERADGTDGRKLGQNIYESSGRVQGTRWSTSGKWLAWWGDLYPPSPGPSQISDVWIIRTDGTGQKNLFNSTKESITRIADVTWSPRQDLLLVAYTLENCGSEEAALRILIYDVEHDRAFLDVPMPNSFRFCGNSGDIYNYVQWSPDGQAFAYAYEEEDDQSGYTLVTLDGSIQSVVLDEDERLYSSVGVSGFLMYRVGSEYSQWLVVDPFTQATFQLNQIKEGQLVEQLKAGAFVAFLSGMGGVEGSADIPASFRRLQDTAWLEAMQILLEEDLYPPSLADPRIQAVLIAAAVDVTGFEEAANIQISGTTALMTWETQSNTRNLYLPYDFRLRQFGQPIVLNVTSIVSATLSDSGRYLGVGTSCVDGLNAGGQYCLIDLQTQHHYIGYPPSTNSVATGYAHIGQWHPTQDSWVLIGFTGMDGAGLGSPSGWSVTNLNGSVVRELGRISGVLGWLPAHVAANLPDSGQSLHVAPHGRLLGSSGSALDAVWSPDSSKVAVCTYNWEIGKNTIDVWNVADNRLITSIELNTLSSRCGLRWLDQDNITNAFERINLTTQIKLTETPYDPQATPRPRPTPTNLEARAAELNYHTPFADGWDIDYASSDGRYLAVEVSYATGGSHLGIFDSQYEEIIITFPLDVVGASDVRFSPDVKYLAEVQNTYLRIYDVATWQPIMEVYASGRRMSWSPDSRYVMTASSTGAFIWAVPQPDERIENNADSSD